MESKGSIENLYGQEAIKKIQELVNSQTTCLFGTNLGNIPLTVRPMATLKVDDGGNLWFFSFAESDKNREIKVNAQVQLFYSNTSSYEFLSVFGTASELRNTEKARELWTPISKAWFPEGAEDPNLTILKVEPIEAHYWDTKTNRIISMLKIMTSVLTGNASDDGGVQGNLNI